MQKMYVGNNYSLVADEPPSAQQLISDILTCFAADVLDRAPLTAEAPHSGAPCRPYIGAARRALQRRPIEAPHRKISLAPY